MARLLTVKRYTIRECGKGPIVAGLDSIPADNANLQRLAPDAPLDCLGVGQMTYGRRGDETYEIVRGA